MACFSFPLKLGVLPLFVLHISEDNLNISILAIYILLKVEIIKEVYLVWDKSMRLKNLSWIAMWEFHLLASDSVAVTLPSHQPFSPLRLSINGIIVNETH